MINSNHCCCCSIRIFCFIYLLINFVGTQTTRKIINESFSTNSTTKLPVVVNNSPSYIQLCIKCDTRDGFEAYERRSIIVMVVLTGVALILCVTGVLIFTIRDRAQYLKRHPKPIAEEIKNVQENNNAYEDDNVDELPVRSNSMQI
ncbi:unnamed protein product [Didymodactylos carnosus]|nr:unnamed protein product [Didymodactylos carnosus]CAF4335557.1 unnamed protein product [Didymodactylos carnosus]